jgi:ubiquitin carboxyl-terminal hydrolase 8
MDNQEIIKNIYVRGLSGLTNIGNTCYMNSALQCLSACNLLTSYILNKNYKKDLEYNIIFNIAKKYREENNLKEDDPIELSQDEIDNNIKISLTNSYYELLKTMWESNCEVTPRTFKKIIGFKNRIFNGINQNDSHELIISILDIIQTEIGRQVEINFNGISGNVKLLLELKETNKEKFNEEKIKNLKDYTTYKYIKMWKKYIQNSHSIINNIFMGMFYNEFTPINTDVTYTSFRFEPYNVLTLHLPDKPTTLQNCLDNYFSEEYLLGDNKYKCKKTNKYVEAKKKIYLWETPEILIIQLKRFKNMGVLTQKNNVHIKYPLDNLDLSAYNHKLYPRNHKYMLFGVVQHMGSLNGGHYIAHTKNPINHKWYEFNDSKVRHIPDEQVENVLYSYDSYILFYKKN